MSLYINDWADETAMIMTDNGQVLCVYPSFEDARRYCLDDYSLSDLLAEYKSGDELEASLLGH